MILPPFSHKQAIAGGAAGLADKAGLGFRHEIIILAGRNDASLEECRTAGSGVMAGVDL